MLKRVDNTPQSDVPAGFVIASRRLDGRTAIVSVQGELDLSTAPRLKWMLLDELEAGSSELVVDLTGVTFIDSTALGVLVGVNRSPDLGAPLAIICRSGHVRQVFDVSGTDRSFRMCSTLDEALAQAVPAD